jgi:hypothetical protein
MPIRLNLLAEAQAAEDERRRDPVKRALWLAALLIAVMLAWSSVLQLRITLAKSETTRMEAQMGARTNEFQQILDNQRKAGEINERLRVLRQLASIRLLNGNLLDALQKTTVDDVQLLRLRVDQSYAYTEGTKPHTNDANVFVPGKFPTSTERILLTLEGIDSSPSPGDQVNRFKAALASNAYFTSMLSKTNTITLKSLSPPQLAPVTGKPCVMFTLECRYPEKTR